MPSIPSASHGADPAKLHADKGYDAKRCRQERPARERNAELYGAFLVLAAALNCFRTLERSC